MLDLDRFKEVIREIQDVLYGHVNLETDEVGSLHREYGVAVDEINTRLKRCCELLNSGQRSDALQECDVPPSLFEVVDVADFRERYLWGEFLAETDLPNPPELEKGLAEQIVTAVPQEARLKQLMTKHRLLALARSPLRLRLKVLREIQRKDPENKLWRPDIRGYEQLRLKEMKRESKAAADDSDLKQLTLLVTELEESDWLDAVPTSLAEFVQEGHSRVRKEQARLELEEIAAGLNDAFSNLDLDHARNLRQRWRTRILIVELADDDPLSELAAPALDWLVREDERDTVHNEFTEWYQEVREVLEEEIPHDIRAMESHRSGLSRVFDRVDRLRTELDDDQGEVLSQVTERIHLRLSQMQDRERRVRRNRLVGIVLAIAVVAALAVWGIDHALVVRRARGFSTNIQDLVDSGSFGSAKELIKKVRADDARAFRHPDVQGAVANLDAATTSEQVRLETRSESVKTINERLKVVSWTSRDEAHRLFGELKQRSVEKTDSKEDAEIESELSELTARLQKQTDAVFLKEFDRIKTLYKSDDVKQAEQALDLVGSLLEIPRVTASLLPAARVFRTRVTTDIATLRRSARRASLFDAITKAVGDQNKFRDELKNFSELPDFQAESTSKDFRRVVEKELPQVPGIAQWARLTRDLSARDLSNLSVKDAKTIAVRISTLLEDYPGHPAAKPVAELKIYIDSVVARVAADGASVVEDLEKILNSSIIADLYMLQSSENLRYYSRKRPVPMGTSFRIEYYVKLDLSETKVRLLPMAKLANSKNSNGRLIVDSPQSLFRESTLRKIDQLRLNEGQWHTAFVKMLIELRDDRHMEPLLKFQLLHVVSGMATVGHSVLGEVLKDDRVVLERARTEIDRNVNWIHPEPPDDVDEVKKARRDAVRTIDKLAVLKRIEKAVAERIAGLKQPDLGRHYEWVGWLHKGRDSTFRCSMGPGVSPSVDRDLYLLIPSEDGDTMLAEMVGTCRKGIIRLGLSNVILAVEGRPVFASAAGK
jgi:hypothetical protein